MHFRSKTTFTMSMYTTIKFSRTDDGKKSRNYSFWHLSLILILNPKSFVNTGPIQIPFTNPAYKTTSSLNEQWSYSWRKVYTNWWKVFTNWWKYTCVWNCLVPVNEIFFSVLSFPNFETYWQWLVDGRLGVNGLGVHWRVLEVYLTGLDPVVTQHPQVEAPTVMERTQNTHCVTHTRVQVGI